MSDAAQEAIYPRYCFHLSPTFNAWCLLPTSEIHGLRHHAGFEGENFFFYRKLPIKWVRIVGVVVAIDEYAGRRVFTVDDSSGTCIETMAMIPTAKPPTETNTKTDGPSNDATAADNGAPQPPTPLYDKVEVGAVVDVKGALSTFREEKQIKIEKMVRLKSTAQEVALWEKMARFRRDVLDKPWVLRDKDIRRCRKEAERSESDAERRRRKLKAVTGRGLDKDAVKAVAAPTVAAEVSKGSKPKSKAPPTTSRETTAKRLRELILEGAASGKYSALGL